MNWLNVPHQPQHKPSWCLPACVAMVSAYWGIPVLQADVARWLGTSEIGTVSSRIQQLSNQAYAVIYGEGSLAILSGWLAQGVPLILFVRTGDLPYWHLDTAHAIILAGFDQGQMTIIDPAIDIPSVMVSVEDLLLAWSHFDYTYAALRPAS